MHNCTSAGKLGIIQPYYECIDSTFSHFLAGQDGSCNCGHLATYACCQPAAFTFFTACGVCPTNPNTWVCYVRCRKEAT
eukprot:scaffold58129_cov20-Tisochrysis_lutea.AAC.1